ncbi:hypothetical protein ACFVTC_03370 [Streptomyces sp. NPDC057950]|uniref:hypothetical protein n=1 Tax=Streptomyces sp. NPDC057950 TaxID=3346288 RepID=UPI0036E098E5
MNGEPLAESRITIGAARTVQADAVRAQREKWRLTDIPVDTANRLQGREFDITLVWHPLSGRQAASTFLPETGRVCVLLSRRSFACIVVARAGITDLLDRHPRSSPVYLDVPPKPERWCDITKAEPFPRFQCRLPLQQRTRLRRRSRP